ncbi:hypothetical protein B0H13DRAFT_1855248 [Mycena leptocephala]|nr:hypothetical protein B0H13DRAFT_1855248 [Mycena leptocephala]
MPSPAHPPTDSLHRDNVLFGRPFEEERNRRGRIIEHSCLLPDLRSRADGDLTERLKVIDLSDKQQANIVCAAYCSADVVEMRTHFLLGFPSPIHANRYHMILADGTTVLHGVFLVLITMTRVLKFAFERNVVQISSQDGLFLPKIIPEEYLEHPRGDEVWPKRPPEEVLRSLPRSARQPLWEVFWGTPEEFLGFTQ